MYLCSLLGILFPFLVYLLKLSTSVEFVVCACKLSYNIDLCVCFLLLSHTKQFCLHVPFTRFFFTGGI